MRYGTLRDPSFRSSDLENVGVSQIYPTPFSMPPPEDLNSNTTRIRNQHKIYGVLSFMVLIAIIVTVGIIDHENTMKYFRPLYTMEDAKGLAFLYEMEAKKAADMYSSISEEEAKLLYQGFVAKFAKVFSTEEEKAASYDIFKKTLAMIDQNNLANLHAGGDVVHGLTKYADMSIETFRDTFLTAKPQKSTKTRKASVEPYEGEAAVVDWSGKYTTPVTDQGLCGACWAFSAVNQIESDAIRHSLLKVTDHLSAEQLISCADDSDGCRGGWTEIGFQYVKENGVALFSTYPYADFWQPDHASTCYADRASSMITLTDVLSVTGEDDMVSHIKGVGPLSICINADTWQTYTGGILSSCGHRANHCVQLVGVNTDEGSWKIRNNWGPDWGEKGFIRLAVGSNMCGIETDPHYTVPALVRHDTISVKGIKISFDDSPSYTLDVPDLYIVFVLGSQTHTTNVLQDSKSPSWPEQFQMNWDGVSDLKVYMYDSNWFLSDILLGSLQINLLSTDFPLHSYSGVKQSFDDSKSAISFDLRMDPLSDNLDEVDSLGTKASEERGDGAGGSEVKDEDDEDDESWAAFNPNSKKFPGEDKRRQSDGSSSWYREREGESEKEENEKGTDRYQKNEKDYKKGKKSKKSKR